MAPGFLKRNEKVLMTLLLLVLAPAFAFTGIMTWYFTQGRQNAQPVYRIFERTYSQAEWTAPVDERSNQWHVNAARRFGPFYRRVVATEPAALEYLMRLHEIDRLGLRLSGEQEQEALREAAIDVITWMKVIEDPTAGITDGQQAQLAFFTERGNTSYNPDEYRRVVTGPRLGLKMTLAEFEEIVRTSARIRMISDIVAGIPYVTEKEIYDEYFLDRQKRGFEFVQIPTERFLEDARAEMDDEYVRSVYDANPFPYRKDASLKLRIAKADRDKFVDPDFDPSLEVRQERYERDKARYKYPPNRVVPEGQVAEEYRPLTEVFELVFKSLSDDDAQERERAVLEAGIARAAELAAMGEEWKLEDTFAPEDLEKLVFEETDWFTRRTISALSTDYQNYPVLSGLFNVLDPEAVGDVGPEVVTVRTGNYIYRLAGAEEASTQTFEEAIVTVTENAEKQKARELTTEFLDGWVERIRNEPETTLHTFSAEENYTVHVSENPLSQTESGQLKLDDKRLLSGPYILRGLFADCDDVGDVTNPASYPQDDNIYIAVVTEIAAPDMVQWEQSRPGLESRIRQRRLTAIAGQYRSELERRAQITPLWTPKDPDGDGPG
jgi:hypothetical protein